MGQSDNIVDPNELTINELEEKLEELDPSPEELDEMLQREKETKDRKGATQLLEEGIQKDDWDETYDDEHTKGRYRVDEVTSLLQSAIRRSQDEEAAWCAWELIRSGYDWKFWRRMRIIAIEDLAAGQIAPMLMYRYEMMSKHEFGDTGWGAHLCAIHAALTASRARSSREATYANGYFDRAAKEKVNAEKEDREPRLEPPVTKEELHGYSKYDVAIDKHTMWGRRMGRIGDDGWAHFKTHGERVGPEGETDLGRRYHEEIMQLDDLGLRENTNDFSLEEIDHAIKPTDENGSWGEDSLTKQTKITAFRESDEDE